MKRAILALTLQLICCIAVLAVGFPTHHSTATCDMDTLSGQWDSFAWTWGSYDTQSNTVTVAASSTGYDMTSNSVQFTMSRLSETAGYVRVYSTTNIVVSSSNLTWEIAYTNIPAAGSYFAEIWSWYGTATNYSRTIAQGKIKVVYTVR